MKRKCFLLAVLLLAAAFSGAAQWKVTAGVMNNQITFTEPGVRSSLVGNGWYAGVLREQRLGGSLPLTFEPGLIFDFLSYNVTGNKVHVQYARVPLHLRCDWALDPRTTVFFGAGPGLSVALAGGKHVTFGKEDYSRIDLQAGVEGGICVNSRLAFRAGYDWGLLGGDRPMYACRRGINAGVTFRF